MEIVLMVGFVYYLPIGIILAFIEGVVTHVAGEGNRDAEVVVLVPVEFDIILPGIAVNKG
ncbi:hypothetical protein [Gilliamella sp. Pas-s25]|uniref:hypothetical protein n=1 Tax=Gilliamella sp. Pas-s25 TaxID=2687310 RepID=UPI001F240816|nr:hypothetical protein [Gilliamella sp. Pas-s25]